MMTTSFNDTFRKKIEVIEAVRRAELERLGKDLKRLSQQQTTMAIALIFIWFLFLWPISRIAGAIGNLITLFIFILIYHKVTPVIEKRWQSDEDSLSTKKALYAQLSLAGSLNGSHRRLLGWDAEALGAKYEIHIGLQYESKGYDVEYRGLLRRQFDYGVDLVCTRNKEKLFVQCKYWSQQRHVGHDVVSKLSMAVREEMGFPVNKDYVIKGAIVTSSVLTKEAKKMASENDIDFIEGEKLPL